MATTSTRPMSNPFDSRRLALAVGLVSLGLLACVAPATAAPSFENPHGELSISCEACHSTAGWTPLRAPLEFDHGESGFALEGGHGTVECSSCHEDLEFSNIGSACADCHLDAHLGELGFECESCHSPETWDARAEFTLLHDGTLFPLTGAHRATDCAACHREDPPFEFQLTPTDCFSCHVEDYQSADLDHVALGFPTTCEDCHGTQAWQPARFGGGDFDHDIFFPLRGGHASLDCGACHSEGFSGTPTDCYACHQEDYQSTTDPDHVALGFPLSCENCHGTTTWEGATQVDHDSFFPLNGVHAVLDCQECHADGFEGTPTDCYSCHAADYEETDDPDHVAQGFSTMCEDCHNETDWNSVDDIDHAAFFPLRGAHAPLDCEACHAGGFAGTPTDCVGCHQEDYDGTTDPDHAAEGFPLDCEACHSESSWEDATVDHSFFPLTGQHASLDCESCHADGFEGTPTDCAACHIDDYNQTDDPDHQAAGFPTTCEDCHNTSDWEDADFNHDQMYFPIYSGSHAGEWGSCTDCHLDPGDFGSFSCLVCHEQDEMDDEHDDVGGYVYESMACLNCHPDGEE